MQRLSMLLALMLVGAAGAVAQPVPPPNMVMETALPVPYAEAMAAIMGRPAEPTTPQLLAPAQAPLARAAISAATAALRCDPTAPPADPEIVELARALRCDPDLIYEYVYNNIHTLPQYGSLKGPLGTLLDGQGTAFDQAELMATLLRQAGYSPVLQVGQLRVQAAQLTTWFGSDTSSNSIGRIVGTGGFPASMNGGSTVTSVDMGWAWVSVPIGGTTYVFDPATKIYNRTPIVPNLGTLLSYDSAIFQNNALAGALHPANGISNVNRPFIRSSIQLYATNLVTQMRSALYRSASPDEILGGVTIAPLPLNTRQRITTLPDLTPGAPITSYPNGFPNQLRTRLTLSVPNSCAINLYSADIYGRRLSVFFDSSSSPVPTLRLDGQTLCVWPGAASGTNFGITTSVVHPYPTSFADQINRTLNVRVSAGGAFVISNGWGPTGRGMIERHRRLLQREMAASPNNPTAEPVLGQSLTMLGFTWLGQYGRAQDLIDRIGITYTVTRDPAPPEVRSRNTSTVYQHAVGIVGIQNSRSGLEVSGPYVDLPLNMVGIIQRSSRDDSARTPAERAAFFAMTMVSSVLESGSIEQTQPGVPAVSTVKLIDQWGGGGSNGNIYDISSTTVFDGLVSSGALFNYDATTRADLRALVSGGSPQRLILPANGAIQVGNWSGRGYYQISSDESGIGAIIGAASGGFPAGNVSTAEAVVNLSSTGEISVTSGIATVPGAAAGNSSSFFGIIADPLNQVTGDYVYSQDDLSVGSGAFPYTLGFQRSYDSGRSTQAPGPLGAGWTHNFDMSAQPDSDGFEGMAATSPQNGAVGIAALYVILDTVIMPDSEGEPTMASISLGRMVVATLASRYLMDQLTENVWRIVRPGATESFVRLADSSYNAPIGSASTLAVAPAPDRTSVLRTGDGLTLQFAAPTPNPAGGINPGRITNWSNAAGASAVFAYATPNGNLIWVTTSLGRTLQFGYNGDGRLISASDGTGRTVAYGYDANRLTTVTNPLNQVTRFEYDGSSARLARIFYPSFPTTAFIANTYDSLDRVAEQRDAAGNLTQAFFAGRRSELLEPSGNRHVWYFDPLGRTLAEIQDFGRNPTDGTLLLNITTRNTYDGQSRLTSTTLPEGNRTETTYDEWSNPLTITQHPKPGDPLSPLVQTFTYSPPLAGRDNFRRVATATDPRGNVTSYGYYAATGNLFTVTQPPVMRPGNPAPVSPVSTFTWTPPESSAPGLPLTETDPEGRTTAYEYGAGGNRTAMIIDSGAGRLNLRTTWTYDTVGNATSMVPPRGNAAGADPEAFRVLQRFDAKRRLLEVYQTATSSSTTYIYDPDDRQTHLQVFARDGVNRPVMLVTTTTYTPTGQRQVVTDPSGNTVTYAYDEAERLLTATSSSGRRVRYGYDKLSRIVSITDEVSGTLDPSITLNRGTVVRERRTYTDNGLLAQQHSFRIAGGSPDILGYQYDRFDRLSQTTYPATPSSFEQYGYDSNGNRTLHRTRAGQDIVMTYDPLNRLLTRAVPANANAPAVTYTTGYDLVGRVLRLRQSTDAADVQYEYDPAGRMIREIRPDGRQIGYGRDADGNMTRLTWPTEAGSAFEAAYVYDALGRVTAIHEGADATGPRLALYGYDTASRRLSLERGNTTRTAWGWRPDGQVQTLTHSFSGGASIAFTYLYNREGGLSGRLLNDTTYQAEPDLQASTAYTANALNQYSAIAAASLTYDANGNLTSDGTVTYRYDAQNRLVSFTVSGGGTVSYTYDPGGRRASRGTGRYLYAMGQEIAEYSQSGGTLVTRHVPGVGQDDPLLSITVSNNQRVWYHTDAQGSVIGRSVGAGVPGATQRFSYTPYGAAGAGSGNPPAFRWLGRRLEQSAPTAGLYDMRARVYSASLGRFLQPDPIGTTGGINLYAYVLNNPLNDADTSGLIGYGAMAAAQGKAGRNSLLVPAQAAQLAVPAVRFAAPYVAQGVAAALGAMGIILNQTQSDAVSTTNNEPRITVYRVVDPTELAYLQATGNYGSNPSQSGKYFALTPGGAQAFASGPINAGSTITSTTLPQSVVSQGFPFNDPGRHGAGPSVFFEQPQLPTVYGTMTPPVILPRGQ